MKLIIMGVLSIIIWVGNISAQNLSEVLIQQANVEHNEAVLKFTGDFTTAFSGQMALESFEEFDSESNVAIANQFGNNNISTLIQNGIGNMARIDQEGLEQFS